METKKALYDICFEKANEYLNQTDTSVAQIFACLFESSSSIFTKSMNYIEML